MSEEFTGYGFAVGSVKGLRSFRVDSLGRLTGVHYPEVWTPGENESSCHLGSRSLSMSFARMTAVIYGTDLPRESLAKSTPSDGHDLGLCSCGFYAYYKGNDNPYHATEQVSAVVEGYGRTVLGSKGFRAEKARVVALCVPGTSPRSTVRRLLRPRWFIVTAAALAVPMIALPAATKPTGLNVAFWFLAVAAFVAAVVGSIVTRAPEPRPTVPGLAERRLRLRRNYPDVSFYTSERAMLAAHPTDPSPVPEVAPDTVEDFWTRKAI